MKAVVNEMGILEGKEGHQYFTHSVDLLEKETYLLAGKLVRWSITQGGPCCIRASTVQPHVWWRPEVHSGA